VSKLSFLSRASLSLFVVFACVLLPARSANAEPLRADHTPRYQVELEPHLVLQWTRGPYWNDDGVGVGFRASVPILADGLIRDFHDNLAVSFGLDWSHFGDCGRWGGGCGSDAFLIPIVLQWNFFVTDWLSLFPEFGLAIEHARWVWDGPLPRDCDGPKAGPGVCRDGSATNVELVVWFGARFTLARTIALTVRLGTPSVLFGVSFFL
jgi:hypothetical protein